MRSRTSPPTKLTETQKPVHESMSVRVKVKSSELEGVHSAESIAPGPPAVAEPSALIVPTLYHKYHGTRLVSCLRFDTLGIRRRF